MTFAPSGSMKPTRITKIVSGGQTGADQGGLDAALYCSIPHGGWCPKGRKSENGIIPAKYQLQEMPSPDYLVRTKANVVDSGRNQPGERQTLLSNSRGGVGSSIISGGWVFFHCSLPTGVFPPIHFSWRSSNPFSLPASRLFNQFTRVTTDSSCRTFLNGHPGALRFSGQLSSRFTHRVFRFINAFSVHSSVVIRPPFFILGQPTEGWCTNSVRQKKFMTDAF